MNGGRTQTEQSYPYTAKDETCKGSNSGNYNGAHVTGQYNKWDTTEEEMKDIVLINPVTTTLLVGQHLI